MNRQKTIGTRRGLHALCNVAPTEVDVTLGPYYSLSIVILGLAPRIQLSENVGAIGWMDGRDKPDHDNSLAN